MELLIDAAGVELNEEDDFLDVWFAEQPGGRSLSFQRALHEVDADEAEMGLDSYCLCTEAGRTVYGGVREVELTDGRLRVELLPQKASSLEIDPHLELVFSSTDIGPDVMTNLRSVLVYGRSEAVPTIVGF